MDEDIDIEEHDLLDNPAVRNIFPDLSVLKKEIQNFEDGSSLLPEPLSPEINILDRVVFESDSSADDSIIQNSKPIIKNSSKQQTDDSLLAGKEKESKFKLIVKDAHKNSQKSECNVNSKLKLKKTKYPVPTEICKRNVVLRKHISETNVKSVKQSKLPEKKVKKVVKVVAGSEKKRAKREDIYDDNISVRPSAKRKARDCLINPTNLKKNISDLSKQNKLSSTERIYKDVIVNIPEINLFRSKIIIGSKPNKTAVVDKDCKPRERSVKLKVMLQDIGSYLYKSRRFCVDCRILYPSGRAYSIHRDQSHPSKNLEIQSKKKVKSSKCNKCELCGIKYSCKSNLFRHKRKVHGPQLISSSSEKTPLKTVLSSRNSSLADKTHEKPSQSVVHPCFHCDSLFVTHKALIDHLYYVLEPKEKTTEQVNCTENEQKKNPPEAKENDDTNIVNKGKVKENNKIKKKGKALKRRVTVKRKVRSENNNRYKNGPEKRLYRCPICSYYFYSFNYCVSHISKKHNIKQASNINTVKFDPQCKYCASQSIGMRSYNDHIHLKHTDEFNKIIISPYTLKKKNYDLSTTQEDDNIETDISMSPELSKCKLATKSVLFRCMKCDINFLSANDASCHTKHMELLINWKCPTCNRIFKKRDNGLHLEQHKISDDLIVLELNESELTRVLYSCPKCTIHFTENKYLDHYPKCTSETAESTYCKVCDNLIFVDDFEFHMYCHEHDNLKPNDFSLIDGDIILENEIAKPLSTKINCVERDSDFSPSTQETDLELMVILSYCGTCKCFVNYLGSTRKVHIEARCSHILTYICNYCGLKITQNGIKGHRKLHKKRNDLKLQDFIFYDLNDNKPIRPPIPEFPQCENCKVYFVSRVAILSHECSEDDFLTCEICILKFSEAAFKLHMMFHKYTINNDNQGPSKILENSMVTNSESDCAVSGAISTLPNNEVLKILYQCDTCFVTLTTYDKVVEHCQDHYVRKQEQIVFKCSICDLKFERECFDGHEKLHKLENTTLNSFKILHFDYLYFTSENDIWIKHILGSLSSKEMNESLRESVYKYECRIKMEVIQAGPGYLSIYKCNQCASFIDPQLVYKHVESSTCIRRRHHPCSQCGLPFISLASRMNHEKIHEQPNIRLKSYRIILFNKEADVAFNKLMIISKDVYLLYQCRNCNGIVNKFLYGGHECNKQNLKNCVRCGLLVYEEEHFKHEALHNDLYKFTDKHIQVVLIGNKTETVSESNDGLVPSFKGVINDYTFYQCVNCAICLKKEELRHTCYPEGLVIKCTKCKLLFLKSKIQRHLLIHDKDLDFVRSNMNIIPFGGSKNILDDSKEIVDGNERADGDSTSNDNVVKIYKCSCGLHFVDELNARNHHKSCNPKIRMSKQNCSKCELLFTPNDLFNHLLKHHGDKKRVYKFDIVDISTEVMNTPE